MSKENARKKASEPVRTLPDAPYISAPYNFVPLDDLVLCPEWGEQVSHDVPFSDGLCGHLDIEIEAKTPLFIRDPRDGEKPYKLPDGRYGIPGTSLKGMLRAVVEAANFCRMTRVTGRRYGVRDLSERKLYADHMASILPTKDGKKPCPRVEAAWLVRSKNDFYEEDHSPVCYLEPCDFAKVHYSKLKSFANAQGVHGKAGDAVRVPYEVWSDFQFIHSDVGQQGRLDKGKPNDEWGFWKARLEKGERVPVFYLPEDGNSIRAMGLAMMFRLAYRNSPGDLARKQQGIDPGIEFPDMADLIFGRVDRRQSKTYTLKGRCVIEPALTVAPQPVLSGRINGVLSSPKPTYYPNYVQQGGGGICFYKGSGFGDYSTYMDDAARLRGWKRYQRRDTVVPIPGDPTGKKDSKIETSFYPLESGARFVSRIHFHNLRPIELGALLWSIDFGGRSQCHHSLGMAKAFGYGSVCLSIAGKSVRTVDGQIVADLEEIRKSYIDYMNGFFGSDWESSPHVRALLALAKPVSNSKFGDFIRHMRINGKNGVGNEFVNAKKKGNRLALVPPIHGISEAALDEEWKKLTRPLRDSLKGEYQRREKERKAAEEEKKRKAEEEEAERIAKEELARKYPGMTAEEIENERRREEKELELLEVSLKDELEKAFAEGRQTVLLKEWMQDDGPARETKKAVAGSFRKLLKKGWKKKHVEIWNWLLQDDV